MCSSVLPNSAILAEQPSQPPTPTMAASAFASISAHKTGSSVKMLPWVLRDSIFTAGISRETMPPLGS